MSTDEIALLLWQALELPPDDRERFLREQCGGDDELAAEISSLLAAHNEVGDFLESPASAMPGQAVDNVSELDGGSTIGPYELLRRLGEGETSTVYLAVRADEQYRKLVAIKLLKRGMDTDSILQRFQRERQILAALEHPNIARLLDGGSTPDGRPYFVMEYVVGDRIDSYCDRHGLGVRERIELFRTVCDAVQHAHGELVVHRDIKPGNILITPKGEPRLLDFGIAKLLDPDGPIDQTATAARLMTPRYASPEQVLGRAVSTATDIYSLGVLLYELLTGRRPYAIEGSGLVEVERAICHERPEPPSVAVRSDSSSTAVDQAAGGRRRLARRLTGDLDTIVMKAMRKEPQRRYGSVHGLDEDLGRHLARLPIAARGDSIGYRTGRFLRRNAIAVAATAVVTVGLLTGLVVALWQAEVARRAQTHAESQQARAEQQQERAERVSEFLVDLFQVSDPELENAGDITARQMLDRASETIAAELEDQPLVQATLMKTMGSSYRNLGMYDEAEPLFRKALEIHRRTPDRDATEYAGSLNNLASLMALRGRLEESASLYREAIEVMQADRGDDDPQIALIMNNLGTSLRVLGRLDESERLHREALAIHQAQPVPDDKLLAVHLNNMAAVLDLQGKYDEAEQTRHKALVLLRTAYGDDHPYVGLGLNNLARQLMIQNRHEEAERVQREANELLIRALGEKHPSVATGLHNLANMIREQGRYRESVEIARTAIDMHRELVGTDHPVLPAALSGLASSLASLGELEEAERSVLEALDIRRRTGAEEHHHHASSLAVLAHIRSLQGDLDEAESIYRRSLEISRAGLPAGHERIAIPLVGLGALLVERSEPTAAEPLLREAVDLRSRGANEHDRALADAKSELGACLVAQGRHDEAEALLLSSHEIYSAVYGPEHPETAEALARIIALYEAWGRQDRAEQYTARLNPASN